MNEIFDIIAAVLRGGTPLVYVTLAAVIAQRAGVWHLGLEGLMIAGACVAVLGSLSTGSIAYGLLLAVAVCVAASIALWFVIERLRADAIIAGLGLSGFGLGATHFAVQAMFDTEGAVRAPVALPKLAFLPEPFAFLSVLALAMPFTVWACWLVLRRTRLGLLLAACGEHPFAARSVGTDPASMRLGALIVGGVLCALGGADLALGSLQLFTINMTAGRGYMAFAASIFGGGHPVGGSAAALFFATVETLGIKAQLLLGNLVSPSLVLTVPYLATVFAIWLSSRLQGRMTATPTEMKGL